MTKKSLIYRLLVLMLFVSCLFGCCAEGSVSPAVPSSEAAPETLATCAPETAAPTQELTEAPEKKLIVIDPGHQLHADLSREPVGPGSDEMKLRVSGGTAGIVTGLAEHELNLSVCFLLRDILLERGYEVVLTRQEADVSISNAERAAIANDLQADAFIRIHANGSESQAEHGALTICMTSGSPYNADLYDESYALCEDILDCMCASTGAKRLYVWQTDTMTGINYSQVPVCIVEMGFMTNPDEDRLMASEEYQQKLAAGIADGIDKFFEVGQ